MQSYFKCNGFWGNDCTHIDEKTGENEKFNWWNSNQADSGWVSLNDQHYVYYRLKNGYVTVVINSNSEIIDGTVLGQLPNNLIPQKDLYTSNYSKNGAALCIRTNGDVSWNNTSSYNHCAVTYPI